MWHTKGCGIPGYASRRPKALAPSYSYMIVTPKMILVYNTLLIFNSQKSYSDIRRSSTFKAKISSVVQNENEYLVQFPPEQVGESAYLREKSLMRRLNLYCIVMIMR